ncbi:MAG: gamma-glutamyl-gamma-aminobutyrate hydrolase family protein [Rikenellaceae bacterium]|nr:gamma-glutamyl-gamma-aminobutyrate hydrolase family protein [Rikenellaceae bacterium]
MDTVFTHFHSASEGARPRGERFGQPVIGLSVHIDRGNSQLHEAYIRSVLDASGIPWLIPALTDAHALREITDRIDGLILTGGGDVQGRYFGEDTLPDLTDTDSLRDAYDFLLLRLASDRQIPVLGICRGAQVLNIAFGRTIWQDIPSQYPKKPVITVFYLLGKSRFIRFVCKKARGFTGFSDSRWSR